MPYREFPVDPEKEEEKPDMAATAATPPVLLVE